MKKYEVTGHEPSFLPEGNWELAWSDEFDGTELDRSKWDYRTCMMGRRHEAWTENGVTLDGNSNAVFTLIEENGKPVSSQLQTGHNFMDEPVTKTKFLFDDLQWPIGKLHENKFTHRFGYYECRCRLQQKKGWWSAFWIQSPMIGASLDSKVTGTEMDVMECFEPGVIIPNYLHTGGYGLDSRSVPTRNENIKVDEKEFHRFGVLWDENGYTFYIDGVETGRSSENLSHTPEFILITTEVGGYRGESHAPCADAYDSIGDTFLVDYVRVFDRVD